MASISYPLNSNTLANPEIALYSGGGAAGVQSVAAGAGISVTGTSSVTVTNANLAAGSNGAIQLSNGSGILKNVTGVSAADNGTLSATAVTTGAVNCSSVASTGNITVPYNFIHGNTATLGQLPGVTGMGGSRKYNVTIPANSNQTDIGVSALLNDTVPHLFSLCVTTSTAPGTAFSVIGLIQSFSSANGQSPILTAVTSGNGYAFPTLTGTPGAYVLGLNSSLGVSTVANVCITMIY